MILSEIRKLAKCNQFIYFSKVRLCNRDYKINRRKMAEAVKSSEQIAREMRLVQDYWGCKPLHYVRYGLFDMELSDEQLLDYIPPYYFYNYYTPPIYKDVDRKTFGDKLGQCVMFAERGIRTAETVALFESGHMRTLGGEALPVESLSLPEGGKLFIKPVDGQGGTGIIVVGRVGDSYYCDQREIALRDVVHLPDRDKLYVVQRGISQRSDISAINPSSVNTLRVVTQLRNGVPHMNVCVMRIGRNGKDVDNSHQGGLSVRIDVDSGRMYPTATAEHGGGVYTKHPDTGFVFEDFSIQGWDRLKSDILDYALRIPEISELAWDVAITDDGAAIIEVNLGYGLSHLQCCCGGMRRIIGVYPQRH